MVQAVKDGHVSQTARRVHSRSEPEAKVEGGGQQKRGSHKTGNDPAARGLGQKQGVGKKQESAAGVANVVEDVQAAADNAAGQGVLMGDAAGQRGVGADDVKRDRGDDGPDSDQAAKPEGQGDGVQPAG